VTTLPYRFPPYPRAATAGAWLALQPSTWDRGPVIDLERGVVTGGVDRDPLAVTRSGWILLEPEPRGARPVGPPYPGPLRWYLPGPAPAARP
jgi:hypothetical protein